MLRSENKVQQVLNVGSMISDEVKAQSHKILIHSSSSGFSTPECFLKHPFDLVSLDSSSVGIEEILDPVYVPNSFVEENTIKSVFCSIVFRCFFCFSSVPFFNFPISLPIQYSHLRFAFSVAFAFPILPDTHFFAGSPHKYSIPAFVVESLFIIH